MEDSTNGYNEELESFTFKDITTILNQYKWSIIFLTMLSAMGTYAYTYFKPSLYESYAIIKVKPSLISNKSEDIINNTVSTKTVRDVTEEISLLKTFKINEKAIDKIHFDVRYFIEEKYRKVEIYENKPIKIDDIKITDKDIIGKRLTIIPKKNGYFITYIPSYREKIEYKLFQKQFFIFKNSNQLFEYNQFIKTAYFSMKVNKNSSFNKPIHFSIQGDKRDIFENIIKQQLTVMQLEKDTSLIKISYQDNISDRAKIYVKSLTDNFIQHSINNKNKQNIKTLTFIRKELYNIKKELKDSEQRLEAYQVSKTIINPSMQGSLFIKKLSNIEVKIAENDLKTKLVLNLITFVRNNHNLDAIAPSISKLDDSNTLKLIETLQSHQLKEEAFILEYTDKHPKLKSLRRQMQKIREKIEFNLKSLRRDIEYQNINLLKRQNSYEKDLKSLPSQERHLINIKRNYEVKSRMYEYLLRKEAESKIVQFATFSDYQIIDNAYTSTLPIKNKGSILILISVIFGSIFSSILSIIRYHFNKNIQSQQDIKKLTTLPIYGTIPFLKQKKYKLKVHTDPRSPFSEGFRTLRTNLQFMRKDDLAMTILVTSTVASEGKTTISTNLAKILEMAHYKVVLINLDIRKPTLHKFFSIENTVGISGYLDGQYSAEEIILKTEFGTLDVITSGPIPENPSELILSKRLPTLFAKLKKQYDYIIIDTAPIGIVTDTKSLMNHTDLNLILFKEDFAKKEFIPTIEQMIGQYQFKNIGLILNASKIKGGEYGYGYSYEYK
jgi:capsular exopolysaccharide synthesis family protein